METVPDIIYPVIEAHGDNIELRYSLRSLSNTRHGRVILVGHKPDWVQGVTHLPYEDLPGGQNRLANTAIKEMLACCESQAQDVVIMHDDVYITRPTEIGYYTNARSAKGAAADAKGRGRPRWVLGALQNIQNLFGEDALTAYVHVPHRVNRCKNIRLYGHYDVVGGDYLTCDVYANQYSAEHLWEAVSDQKAYLSPNELLRDGGNPFVSTSDRVAVSRGFEGIMNNLFPDKCRYEQ